MIKTHKKQLLLVMTTLALTLTGCAANQTSTPVAKEAPAASASQEGQEVSSQPVKVTHVLGETQVPKQPKNVVVLELGILDAMNNLGIEVKGVPLSGTLPEYLKAYEDESKYTNVGSLKELDMEKIYELQPDLIIIGTRQADYYEELTKIAPTISLAVDNKKYLESFKANMNYLGEIFDQQDQVKEKIQEIESAIEKLAKLAAEKKVNGLITLADGEGFSVYGPGSRFGIIHNEFGIAAVDPNIEVSTHGQKASFEYIAEQNPDYLFVVDRSAVVAEKGTAPTLFDNAMIKGTKAYQNNHIIYLNPTIWYTAGGGFTSTLTMVDEVTNALEK